MDRRRVWLALGVVVATIVTAILAVTANTGLLKVDRPSRRVGRLTPAAVSVAVTYRPVPVASGPTTPPVDRPSTSSHGPSNRGTPNHRTPDHDGDHDADD